MTKVPKHTNYDIIEKALCLGFKVIQTVTRRNGDDRVRIAVCMGVEDDELFGGSGPGECSATKNLTGTGGYTVEESVRRAYNDYNELCARVAEAAEDFSVLNRNIEGRRHFGGMSVAGDHDDDCVVAGAYPWGANARVEYGGEVVADASADTLQEAIRECKLQLQGTRDALAELHAYVSEVDT